MVQLSSYMTNLWSSRTAVGLAFRLSYYVMSSKDWRQVRVPGLPVSMLLLVLLCAGCGGICVEKLSEVQSSVERLHFPSLLSSRGPGMELFNASLRGTNLS
uniref:Uncharacterized protein MANES_02G179400 n=1 Tax=Rhizophora mucronata TaxID=61149 RepID=A0A2P2MFJ7_RHIMU